jgi:predicted site-specific integrase-resolvase
MSRKVKLVTPKEYAEINGVAYTTVLYWLNNGRVEGAVKYETPRGPYWELPVDAPRPKKLSGRPKKSATKKSKKGAAK